MRRNLSVALILSMVTHADTCLAGGKPENNLFSQRAMMTAANCPDVKPYNPYRLIEGVDPCLQLLSAADLGATSAVASWIMIVMLFLLPKPVGTWAQIGEP